MRIIETRESFLVFTSSLNTDTELVIDRNDISEPDFLGGKVSGDTMLSILVSSKVTAFIALTVRVTINIWEDVSSRSINRMSNVIFEFLRVSSVVTVVARNDETCITTANSK